MFEPFARRVAALGAVYSLGQLVLKLASPGVPDFYQGSEFWTLTLVDPDNRRPVDFDLRERALASLEPLLTHLSDPAALGNRPNVTHDVRQLAGRWQDGHIKLFVTAAGLRLRRALPALFLAGRYEPLTAHLDTSAGVVAFARRFEGQVVIALASRTIAAASVNAAPGRPIKWGASSIELPSGCRNVELVDMLTGNRHHAGDSPGPVLRLNQVLSTLPVALLWGEVR